MQSYRGHKKVLLFLASISFCCFMGCDKGAFKGKQTGDTQSEPIPVQASQVHYYDVDELNYTLKPLEQPHNYDLTIFWPRVNKTISVLINKKVIKSIKPQEGNSFSSVLPDNTKINLLILNELNEKLAEWNFETPKDYVFNSTEILSQDTEVKAQRVFFKNKSTIETKEFRFSIEADEIFFEEGAKIINFQAPPKSVKEQDGISGGKISIFARLAYGKIQMDLSGGDGGKGFQGIPWIMPGPNGKNGNQAVATSHRDITRACFNPPTNGEPAPDGAKGKTGLQGQKGGNSGTVIFEILNQSEVEVIHSVKPGAGGEGGDGGTGQMPGLPGNAGLIDEDRICPPAAAGPATAKNGEKGDQGPIGIDGDFGPICISIGRGTGVCRR